LRARDLSSCDESRQAAIRAALAACARAAAELARKNDSALTSGAR
jgi:hypothetical protein